MSKEGGGFLFHPKIMFISAKYVFGALLGGKGSKKCGRWGRGPGAGDEEWTMEISKLDFLRFCQFYEFYDLTTM